MCGKVVNCFRPGQDPVYEHGHAHSAPYVCDALTYKEITDCYTVWTINK